MHKTASLYGSDVPTTAIINSLDTSPHVPLSHLEAYNHEAPQLFQCCTLFKSIQRKLIILSFLSKLTHIFSITIPFKSYRSNISFISCSSPALLTSINLRSFLIKPDVNIQSPCVPSGVPLLVSFGATKEIQLPGMITHAIFFDDPTANTQLEANLLTIDCVTSLDEAAFKFVEEKKRRQPVL